MAIFTMLILPIYEHGRSFHFLSFIISFFRDLKLLSHLQIFTCLVRVTPRHCILFVAIVEGVVSPFLSTFIICKKESYSFVWVFYFLGFVLFLFFWGGCFCFCLCVLIFLFFTRCTLQFLGIYSWNTCSKQRNSATVHSTNFDTFKSWST